MNSIKNVNLQIGFWAKLKYFAFYFPPMFLVVGGIIMTLYHFENKSDKYVLENNQTHILSYEKRIINNIIKSAISDLMLLSEQRELYLMLKSGIAHVHKERLNDAFLEFSSRKTIYDQVRFIDRNGIEIVRANFNDGQPYSVPEEDLQNKADSYYFKSSMFLEKDEIFISSFDLNVEGEQIDSSYKPTIRFGTPVFGANGSKCGVLILNYNGNQILNSLNEASINSPGEILLINSDGLMFKGDVPDDKEEHFCGNMPVAAFRSIYPNAFLRIYSAESGQFYNEEGLFTFLTIQPLTAVYGENINAVESPDDLFGESTSNELRWKIVSHVNKSLTTPKSGLLGHHFLQLSATFVILAIGSWFLSIFTVKRRYAEQEIVNAEKRLSRQNEAFGKLEISEAVYTDNKKALETLTETTAWTLQVERVSIWLYNNDHSSIYCKDLYEQSNNIHSEGVELSKVDYPEYFDALNEERAIDAHDAHTDPRTMEFSESYLAPLGITAMLDAPIRVQNKMIGVVCCEHTGTVRKWTIDEQNFATAVADFVSLSLETSARMRVEGELRKSKDELEMRVHERTESLFKSESKIRAIVENAVDAIVTIDEHGLIDMFNLTAERMFGYKAEETKGKNVSMLMPQPYRDEHNGYLANYIRTSERKVIGIGREVVGLRKNGETFPCVLSVAEIETRGKRLFTGSIIDITKRKKADEQIRKLSRAVEESPATVVITDVNGNIEYVNPRFTQVTGYTAEEVIGENTRILQSGEQKPEIYKELWSAISSGNEWRGEFHNKKKDGTLHWESASISPIKDEKGVITNFIAIKEDITARKITEQKLKDSMVEAQRANEAKSTFLSSMSHELRTPLNSILGFAQLLESDASNPPSESQKENIRPILQSGNHLLKLINEILDLSRIESGKLQISYEDINMDSVISESIATVGPTAQQYNIKINNLTKHDGLHVRVDFTRLKQIIINLLTNAIKYNNVEGSVTISSELLNKDMIRINIEDTGPGIAKENFGLLFEPFNRLGAEALRIEGTGIGLTITKKLVEVMGGSIGVESEVGKGSKFYVDLERAKYSAHGIGKTEDVLENQQHYDTIEKTTLLYIEDNQDSFMLVEKIMKRRPNIELISASQAETGIEIAHTKHPDVILMDINLPGMDGFNAFEILKSYDDTKRIPVIAISANAIPKNIEKAKSAGFKDYITKPINVSKFLKVIDAVLTPP